MIVSIRIVIPLLLGSFSLVCSSQVTAPFEMKIDSIISEAIQKEAFPGCVVYASKSDSVIFFKSYGFHTYDSTRRVAVNDVYDLASVSKATGATLAMMKLYDDGLINLDDPVGKYIEKLGGGIGKATIRECMAHQAGLRPWIPYYQEVRKKNGKYKKKTVGPARDGYDYPLSDSLFLHKDFYARIKKMIKKSSVSDEKVYRYSGLFFYLVPELVTRLTGYPYDTYLYQNFYERLEAATLVFNPLDWFDSARIVPTENDTYFRMRQIHGTVHDEGRHYHEGNFRKCRPVQQRRRPCQGMEHAACRWSAGFCPVAQARNRSVVYHNAVPEQRQQARTRV